MKKNEPQKQMVNMNYQIYIYPAFADPRDDFFDTDIGIFMNPERALEVYMKYAGTTGVELVLTRKTNKQLGNKRTTDPSDEEIDQVLQDFIHRYDISTKGWASKKYKIWCDYYDYQEDYQEQFERELIAEFYCRPQHALDYFKKCENDRYILPSRLVECEIHVTPTSENSNGSEEYSYDDDLGELMDKVDSTNECN